MVEKPKIVSVLVLKITSSLHSNEQDNKGIFSINIYKYRLGHYIFGHQDRRSALSCIFVCGHQAGDIRGYTRAYCYYA